MYLIQQASNTIIGTYKYQSKKHKLNNNNANTLITILSNKIVLYKAARSIEWNTHSENQQMKTVLKNKQSTD